MTDLKTLPVDAETLELLFQTIFGRNVGNEEYKREYDGKYSVHHWIAAMLNSTIDAARPGTRVRHQLVNNASDLEDILPDELRSEVFQIVQLPLRALVADTALVSVSFSDAGREPMRHALDGAVAALRRSLKMALKYNHQCGIPIFVLNFAIPQANPLGRLLPKYDLLNFSHFVSELNRELWSLVASEKSVYVQRSASLQALVAREGIRQEVSEEEYIAGLAIRIQMGSIRRRMDARFAGAFELLNKANQFNTTGQRWTEQELAEYFEAGGVMQLAMVTDRLSEYGLTSVLVHRRGECTQLVMSCRVFGLRGEFAMLQTFLQDSQVRRRIRMRDTGRNALCRRFFEKRGLTLPHDCTAAEPVAAEIPDDYGLPSDRVAGVQVIHRRVVNPRPAIARTPLRRAGALLFAASLLGMCASVLSQVPRHVAIVGDSYVQQVGGGTPLTAPVLGAANIALVNVLADQPWVFDPLLDDFGVAGGTDADLLAKLPAILRRHPDVLFIQGGHNDFIQHGAARLPTMIREWEEVISSLRGADIQPVLILDPPIDSNEGSPLVSVQQLRRLNLSFNAWKVAYARRKGLLVWDWNAPEVDPSDPEGAWRTGFTDDGVHPNFAGNLAAAQWAIRELASIIGQPTASAELTSSRNDTYDPTNHPYGNLVPVALFTTPGGFTHGGFRGDVPVGFATNAVLSGTGKSLATSLVNASDKPGPWWQLAIAGQGAGGTKSELLWGQTAAPFGRSLAAGTIVEGWVQIEVEANSPFNSCMGKLVAGTNVSLGNAAVNPGFHDGAGPTVAWKGTIYIPPLQIPATGYPGMNLYLQCQFNDVANGFAGTVRWRRPTVRVVPSQ